MDGPESIPADVARKLGFYVYLLVNPLDGRVFYVGKGKNPRALMHLQDTGKSRKAAILRQIHDARKVARIEILAHGLKDAETALRIEAGRATPATRRIFAARKNNGQGAVRSPGAAKGYE